jgi:hypothetical protein
LKTPFSQHYPVAAPSPEVLTPTSHGVEPLQPRAQKRLPPFEVGHFVISSMARPTV